jgi:hypothetical protein
VFPPLYIDFYRYEWAWPEMAGLFSWLIACSEVLINPLIDISSLPAITEIPKPDWLRETASLLPLVDR